MLNTADEDLRHLLAKDRRQLGQQQPREPCYSVAWDVANGCTVRATMTSNWCRKNLGPVPVAGFFCNGEIGPVGARAFIHGFTSVVGLFLEPEPAG